MVALLSVLVFHVGTTPAVAEGETEGPAAPSPPYIVNVTPEHDRATVTVTAPARTSPTEYWVDHGTTTEYGEQSTRQQLDAGESQQLTFVLSGLVRGERHLRAASLTAPATEPVVGIDSTFFVSGINFLLKSTRPTGDGAYLLTSISARDVATEYWIEYGSTSAYGQRTAAQTVPASSSTSELLFQVSGLAPGTYYARPVASSVGTETPDVGEGVTFTTSSQIGAPWPMCADEASTQCIRSFTVDGAVVPGVRPDVFFAGGGLNIHAISARGDQELIYPGSPVSATSTVSIVVDAGSYDADLLLANAHVQTARIDRSGDRNVITFAARPERTSFINTGCHVGACGGDTTRANDEYAGRWVVAAVPLLNNDLAYTAAARQGMWLSSNAQSRSTPGFDAQTRTLRMSLAGPHLTAAGEINAATFQGFIPQAMFTDVWKISGPQDVVASVTEAAGDQPIAADWTPAPGGWVLTFSGMHYSSPNVALSPRAGAPAPSPSPTASTAPTAAPHQVPRLVVSPYVVKFGQTANVTIIGTPGATVDLYTRKYMGSFVRIRSGLVLDSTGRTTVATRPDMNLRFLARDRQVAQGSSIGGTDGLMTVEKQVSINVQRVGVRRYTFTGSINPMSPGAVVHLYRNGVLVRTSIPVNSLRVYSFTGTFPAGTATFRVTSPSTGYNNLSHSVNRSIRIY